MKNRKFFRGRHWFIPVALIAIIAVSLITAEKHPEPEIEEGVKTWVKAFERFGEQSIFSIQQTPDGGYIAAGVLGRNGTESSTGRQFADAYLLKLDSDGNVTWEKTIGGNKGSLARDIQQTSDGGYIIVGAVWNYFDLGTEWDVYLVKTDENGNKTWEKAFDLFGMSENDWAWSVQQTSDGGYIIGGWTLAYVVTRLDDAFLLKIDAYGNKLWEKNYGGADIEDTRSAQQTSDGGYIIAGWTSSFNSTKLEDQNVYLVKTDTNGNILWERAIDAFDKHEQDGVLSIQQTSDGGFILAGNTQSVGGVGGNLYAYLLKVDNNGNKLWENYASEGILRSVQQTSDGGYVVAGDKSRSVRQTSDGGCEGKISGKIPTEDCSFALGGVYLLKMNANGNKIWDKVFRWNETESNFGYSVQQTSDGGYIIAAEIQYSSNPWQPDILLIKTDGNGNIYGYSR